MADGIVFAAIAPHGGIAIPEACEPGEEGLATATQEALAELGRRFDASEPDTTIVITPHNVHVENAFAVIVAGSLEGELSEDVRLVTPSDPALSLAAIVSLVDAGLPAVGVSYGGNDPAEATMPMDWGTLIPLWYMGGRREEPAPVVIVCPCRDRPLEEHVRAGRALAEATAGSRVALIASADHGHGHDPDGPYGFDEAAAEYDRRVVELIRQNRLEELLELDPELVEAAKVDSLWQLLMLHGALEGDRWKGELLSYEAPTYFGMACAAYER